MKIRDIGRFEIVVSYLSRRCDGRSRTPAPCSHRPASLQGGAPALPKPIQQTPIHAAAVAGDSLPMSSEDWIFREAELRLCEHRELRQPLGLVSVPDFTTLY